MGTNSTFLNEPSLCFLATNSKRGMPLLGRCEPWLKPVIGGGGRPASGPDGSGGMPSCVNCVSGVVMAFSLSVLLNYKSSILLYPHVIDGGDCLRRSGI